MHAPAMKAAFLHLLVSLFSTPAISCHAVKGEQQTGAIRAMLAVHIYRPVYFIVYYCKKLFHIRTAGISPVIQRNIYEIQPESLHGQSFLLDHMLPPAQRHDCFYPQFLQILKPLAIRLTASIQPGINSAKVGNRSARDKRRQTDLLLPILMLVGRMQDSLSIGCTVLVLRNRADWCQ